MKHAKYAGDQRKAGRRRGLLLAKPMVLLAATVAVLLGPSVATAQALEQANAAPHRHQSTPAVASDLGAAYVTYHRRS